MKRKVIVFGATGEIGGRIAHLAVQAGHEVTGVCRTPRDTGINMEGVHFIYGDKYNDSFMESLASEEFDAVIDTIPNDRVIDRCQKYFPNAKNVFFCSSTGTYVPLQYFPADENHPWQKDTGVNFYH